MSGSTARTVQITAQQLIVLQALLDGPKTTTDLSKSTGIPAPQIYHVLKVWERRKVIEKVPSFIGKGITGFRYLWSIKDSGLVFGHPSYDAEITITFPKG